MSLTELCRHSVAKVFAKLLMVMQDRLTVVIAVVSWTTRAIDGAD